MDGEIPEAPKGTVGGWANCSESCVKDWEGGDPKCGFDADGKFTPDWNCGLVSRIRALVYRHDEADEPVAGVNHEYGDDESFATFNLAPIVEGQWDDEDRNFYGFTLWLTWYKHRGSTTAMLIISSDGEVRIPNRDDIRTIATFYEHLAHD